MHAAAGVLIGSYALLTLCLTFTIPPGASPDEHAHYLKALAAGRGDLILDEPPPLPEGQQAELSPQLSWLLVQERVATLPARYDPQDFDCWAEPGYVGTCPRQAPDSDELREFRTYVGRYPPWSYILPGLAMGTASDPTSALLLGRTVNALTSLLLLGAAIWLLLEPGDPWPVSAVVVAVTPMVLMLFATLSSNGVEIAAGLCFFACLLRLGRNVSAPRWVWAAAAASGAALAGIRDLGPLWLALCGMLFVGLTGWRGLAGLVRRNRRAVALTATVLAGATGAAVLWQATQSAKPDVGLVRLAELISKPVNVNTALWDQAVGVFGPLDTPMPPESYVAWTAILGVLVLVAVAVGTARQRLVLAGAVVLVLAVATLTDAAQRAVGFGVQARHVLPFAVVVPLLAGEIVQRSRRLRPRRTAPIPVALTAVGAGVLMVAWYSAAHRFAVGITGPNWFFDDPVWSPPGGWTVWASLSFASVLGVVAASLLAAAAQPPGTPRLKPGSRTGA